MSYAGSDKTLDFDSEEKQVKHASALPSLPTIPATDATHTGFPLSRQHHRTLQRTQSISLTSGPQRVQPAARVPVEFRTLSIQVTDTKHNPKASANKKDVADLATLEWHSITAEEVCTRLGVSPEVGLDQDMATRRLSKDGKNVLSKPRTNWPKRIFQYIFGGFGALLIGASIICFIAWKPLGNPNPQASNLALAVILLVVASVSACFNAWQDYSTGRVMASIAGFLPAQVVVYRDRKAYEMPAVDLVRGDIVKIRLGEKIPADMRIIECSSDVKFDRSILTGESKPVAAVTECTDPNFMESRNIALQGTLCLSGSATGVCVGLGDATVFGRIAKSASGERPIRTSLEQEISRFVLIVASLAASVVIFVVILWAAWLRKDHPDFMPVPALLINCVSVAVAFIPEGLPICVTLSLTIICCAMKKKNILCKSLAVVESLGCVDVICSDKTGTLTQNRMSVVNIALGNDIVEIGEAQKFAAREEHGSFCVKTLAAVAGLCNDASFEENKEGLPLESRKINGDATDSGLLRFSESITSVDGLRSAWSEIAKVSFNSKNKFAVKVVRARFENKGFDALLSESDDFEAGSSVMLVKGAPDVLLRRCSSFVISGGQVENLSEKAAEAITAAQADLAGRGQRVLLLAKKILSPVHAFDSKEDGDVQQDRLMALNTDLTIVGLVSLVDPLRHDTAETVRVCRRAGIRFCMVTGDMSLTAASIARSAGIFSGPRIQGLKDLHRELAVEEVKTYTTRRVDDEGITSLVLSGPELITLNESQWAQVIAYDEVVFARTSPQQKLQIVKMFQADGRTVAVTGDGVNDAAALKQADVGVAVAGGSEVAMEAADLILLDNFSAIVEGVRSGRLCFENLKKSILYLLPAGSFSELMPVIVNVCFGVPQALSNIQMILICCMTDVLPALSLCWEKPEADLLERKPRDRKKERLADIRLIAHAYFFLGVLESLTSMVGAFYFGFHRHGIPFSSLWLKYGDYGIDADIFNERLAHAQSIYFFNLVIMQWFNLLATRTRRLSLFQQTPIGSSRTSNIWIFPAMLAALVLAIFFSYIHAFQQAFGTRGIAVEYFFLPMAYGIVILAIDEVRKAWNRRRPASVLAKVAW